MNQPITAIFIPAFKRSNRFQAVIDNITANTPENTYKIYFILEKNDQPSIDECIHLDLNFYLNEHEACYAGAINTAYEKTTEPYFFTGADDLNFHTGWLSKALDCMENGKEVIGTNDMGDIPIGEARDATHYLISRKYIQEQSGRIDCPNMVLYPYEHNYTDKEFIETAKARGVYAYAKESLVEHLHWAWNKAKMDETYQRGFESNERDRQTYLSRQHLWKT